MRTGCKPVLVSPTPRRRMPLFPLPVWQMMMPHAVMQQGSVLFMQQPPIFRPQALLRFNPQQVQEQQVHQPQMMPFQGHMGVMNGMHTPIPTEPSHGGGSNEVPPGSQVS